MKLGRVIGRVVLSRRDENLPNGFLLVVSPLDKDQLSGRDASLVSKKLSNLVLLDQFGARVGDTIGYVEGAEATAPFATPVPIDAYNVGIVDFFNYNPNL